MEKTDAGTTVGVDDPYEHVHRCDHLTDDGRCRFAVERGDRDPAFARERRDDDYRCPVVCDPDESRGAPRAAERSCESAGPGEALPGPWQWADCPHFRCRDHGYECERCGLAEVRMAHDDGRPLLEEHHLSYADGEDELPGHEITVSLCRWCHAKVHSSWARIDDDVGPDADAVAERESRRAREQSELGFESAADRFDEG
jgi:hypothetical protein